MKKRIVVLLTACLLLPLSACRNQGRQSNGTASVSATPASLVHVSEMQGQYGWNDGFYTSQNNHDGDYGNLMYIDYDSKKKVYLCNKTECQHKDDTCLSYIPVEGAQGLFVDAGKLYRLSNAYSDNGQSVAPGLFVSDLDGTNSRLLYQLDSGMSWLRDFVFGNGMLYADVMTMQAFEDEDGQGMLFSGDDSGSCLLAVDLSNGKAEIVLDLKDKKIIGAHEGNLILSESRGGRLLFSRYEPESQTETPIEDIALTSAVTVGEGRIYYVLPGESTLTALDILSGEISELRVVLPETPDYLAYRDGLILCMQWNGSVAIRAVEAASQTIHNIDLYLAGIEERIPVEVKAQWGDYFLIISGYRMENEYVDWAGVTQDYIDGEEFALIKKEDFLAGKPEYLRITE